MKRLFFATIAAAFLGGSSRADDPAATAVLDKAIQALGGQEKLKKIEGVTREIHAESVRAGNVQSTKIRVTTKGLDNSRFEAEAEASGRAVKLTMVLAGDKGWRKNPFQTEEITGDDLAAQKRMVFLQVVPILLVPLKGEGFKVESAGEEKVGDRPASILKVTAPDGKDFTLAFDKETNLPVRLATTVVDSRGNQSNLERTFADYKDFDGIKASTRIESRRNDVKAGEEKVTEFKALDKVDPDTFTAPK